ncbi:hypothetical protein BYT27DRAFT_7194404 [Phlegmacium glaucopus]|nr:hypothetical protein BYT27DRAFT_7194404 [Phlegmacium glaucopus]
MSFKPFIFVLFLPPLCGSMVLSAPMPLGQPSSTQDTSLLGAQSTLTSQEAVTQDAGKHPVVFLTHPDANGRVEAADISHNHPAGSNMNPATMWSSFA